MGEWSAQENTVCGVNALALYDAVAHRSLNLARIAQYKIVYKSVTNTPRLGITRFLDFVHRPVF
jgi:hypothetical protein